MNPVPGTDTGIVNIADPLGVFLNGFNSAAGAGRACEVPPPPGATERLRIVRQVGTFTATNPIEVRHAAHQPDQHRGAGARPSTPRSAATASTRRRCSASSTARPTSATAPRRRSRRRSASAPTRTSCAAVQAHWRAGTGGDPNILDSDPSAVTDLIAFLRTIDDSTPPFPAADLAPDDPTFADAAALCDCAEGSAAGQPLDCRPDLSGDL